MLKTVRPRRWLAVLLVMASGFATVPSAARAQSVQIIITSLDNIALGTWPGSGNLSGSDKHCVGTVPNNQSYLITATGSGPGGAFTVTNGTSQLAYLVDYRDANNQAWTSLTSGTQAGPFQGWRYDRCQRGRERQQVRVRILESNLSAATAGFYTGTLILLVAPQ